MEENRRKQLDSLKNYLMKRSKDRLKKKFGSMSEPMNKVDYTRENYDRLFPDSKVTTPIGEIELRNDQFKKLKRKGRQNILGAMHQTLIDPIAIINEDREGKKAKLFSKSFSKNKKPIMSVISNEKGKNTAISTHERELNNIINKIKNPADLLYEKPTNEVTGPAGNDTYARDLAISDNTQSSNNIPQSIEEIKRDIAKANREALSNNNL